MRHFPVDVFLYSAGALGLLSWTAEVEIFRLGIPAIYEHIIVYAFLAAVIVAAKGLGAPTVFEITCVIVIAAMTEALKSGISFRHPKTSDFYADMLGFFAVIASLYVVKHIARLVWRAMEIMMFRRLVA